MGGGGGGDFLQTQGPLLRCMMVPMLLEPTQRKAPGYLIAEAESHPPLMWNALHLYDQPQAQTNNNMFQANTRMHMTQNWIRAPRSNRIDGEGQKEKHERIRGEQGMLLSAFRAKGGGVGWQSTSADQQEATRKEHLDSDAETGD
ncbi:hypothetical protein Tco_0064135 [Tanacetum coccineum]